MASLYDTSANSTFNEDKYINKLYDTSRDSHAQALQQGYDKSVQQLTSSQQNTQKQTADYVKRAYVEGAKATGNIQKSASALPSGIGTSAQARLSLGNQQQSNVTALNNQQNNAEQEYQRRRQLLADQYSAQIKQAQADNDMARAQALYEAAKAEEEQLRSFRQTAGTMMYNKGDKSIVDAIAQGTAVTPDTTSETWDSVLKNEDSINKVYDAQIESQRQEAQMAFNENLSELEAQQREATRETDSKLTQTYVDALKKGRNYQEVQTAYGQGSGTSMQARLARETGLAKELTDLRALQLGKDAQAEYEKSDLVRTLGDTIAKAQYDSDLKRNAALYDAAEAEEQALVSEQQMIGNLLAKKNNYSVLGKLYGLTQDQVDRLQGTGKYAPKPVYYGGGGYGGNGGTSGIASGYYSGWSNQSLQNMANAGIAAYAAKGNTGGSTVNNSDEMAMKIAMALR